MLETPQAISVVTQQQLEDQKPQTVNEAFRYSAGVMPEPYGTAAHYTDQYLTVRGFKPDIYQDGLKLPPFSSTYPYFLQRAEIIHGPASVLYGQSSPGGLVDLTSKRPTDQPINEINIGGGTFGRVQTSFDVGGPLDKDGTLLYRITGVGHTDNTQVDQTKDQRFGIAPAVTWRPDASTSFTLLASYINDPNMGIYAGLPATGTVLPNKNGQIPTNFFLGDPNFNTWKREQTSVGYAFEHSFDNVLTFRQNLRYSENTVEERHLYIPGSNIALSADQATVLRYAYLDNINRKAFQVDNQAQLDFGTGPVQHKVVSGIDYLNLNIHESYGTSLSPSLVVYRINMFNPTYGQNIASPAILGDPVTKSDQLGLYVQDQMKWDQTSFVLGGRYDTLNTNAVDVIGGTSSQQYDHAFTWRAGLVHVFDNGLAPYASYSTSFQPQVGAATPSATHLPFVPTTGQQYEVGVKYQPTGYDSFVTVSLFNLTQQNVVTPNPADPTTSVQTGEIRSRGVEVEAHANVTKSFSLIAAYTHLDDVVTKANDGTLGKTPVGIPADMASLWADYAFKGGTLNGFGLSGGVRYVGETYGTASNVWGVAGYTTAASIVPSVVLFDAAMRYDFDKHWRLSVNATNLFDKTYVSSCTSGMNCYYGFGRTVLANLRYAW